jgi:hypothetical protein
LIRAELSMTAVRRTQLARLGVWISLATVAVIVAVFVARTENGIRRIATLLTPSEAARTSKAPQLANRPSDQEAEQRRLAEAIRALSADRDRLATRLTVLERNLDEVTGSIPPAAAKLPQVPVVTSPLPPPATPSAQTNPPIQGSQPPPASQARVAAGHLATGTSAADSVATKTEFGVDIGGNASIEGLRSLWSTLKSGQPALLDGLRPIIAVREGQRPGAVELRLIAGPLPNASIAARLCAALSTAGQSCQPAVFDGQRLALQ